MSNSPHTVPHIMLAFMYQSRYALFLLLKKIHQGETCAIAIEHLDDINIQKGDEVTSLIELKHHILRPADLTDRSVDLWKTIRVWSNHLKSGNSIADVDLLLLTTSKAPVGSIAQKLQQKDRDNKEVLKRLIGIAEQGGNIANSAAYTDFLSLSEQNRNELVNSIIVLAEEPNIEQVEIQIKKILQIIYPPEFLDKAVEELFGWWERKVIKILILISQNSQPVSSIEVHLKLQEIRDSYNPIMPIPRFRNANPPENSLYTDPEKFYLQQLDLLKIGEDRKTIAKHDFYRAGRERSEWTADKLIYIDALESYDERLMEEWKIRWNLIKENLPENPNLDHLISEGRSLYRWIEQDADIPVKPHWKGFPRYLTRGSYHILADKPVVGWHPDYERLLQVREKKDA